MQTRQNPSEFYRNLPRKRIGAMALILNRKRELLIVKPSYQNRWLLPGGSVEENESPRDGCLREVREELGIEFTDLKFIGVDYTTARDDKNESLQFIFYAGELDAGQEIRIDGKEIIQYRFSSLAEAIQLLDPQRSLARRLPQCFEALKKGCPIYLEDGT